jgi:cobalamin-dependent methionine synthase I
MVIKNIKAGNTSTNDDVKKQLEAGANFIDVNAGARIGHEEKDMKWLLNTIQPIATVPLTLDSPDSEILEMAFRMVEKPPDDQLHQPGKRTI